MTLESYQREPLSNDILKEGFIRLMWGSLVVFLSSSIGVGGIGWLLFTSKSIRKIPDILIYKFFLIEFIAMIVFIVGLNLWMRAGAVFTRATGRRSLAQSGSKLMFIGSIVVVLSLAYVLTSSHVNPLAALIGMPIAFILIALGIVLFLFGFARFSFFFISEVERYRRMDRRIPSFKLAGIIWMAGIVFPLLIPIAEIMIALKSAEAVRVLK